MAPILSLLSVLYANLQQEAHTLLVFHLKTNTDDIAVRSENGTN